MQLKLGPTVGNRTIVFYITGDTGQEYIVHNQRNLISHRRMLTCNCKDFTERKVFKNATCKHIDFVKTNAGTNLNPISVPKPAYMSANKVLKLVVSVLNQNNLDSEHLWNILTALRGPDNAITSVKEVTTACIRGALGIRPESVFGASVSYEAPLDLGSPMGSDIKFRAAFPTTNYDLHFVFHYARCVESLKVLGII